ncbi:hypothetical protein ACLOJK_007260 [Asimina triloba]
MYKGQSAPLVQRHMRATPTFARDALSSAISLPPARHRQLVHKLQHLLAGFRGLTLEMFALLEQLTDENLSLELRQLQAGDLYVSLRQSLAWRCRGPNILNRLTMLEPYNMLVREQLCHDLLNLVSQSLCWVGPPARLKELSKEVSLPLLPVSRSQPEKCRSPSTIFLDKHPLHYRLCSSSHEL